MQKIWLRVTGVLFSISIFQYTDSAFEIYFMFPYMLQGYYKLKYPEEYREFEGKSVWQEIPEETQGVIGE